MQVEITIDQAIDMAKAEAKEACRKYFAEQMGGVDTFPCGFAWTDIISYQGKKITGATKIGKALKAAGIEQDYRRRFSVWNPAGFMGQNVDTITAGAKAFKEAMEKFGFECRVGNRLD